MAQTLSTYKLITLESSLADILIRNSVRSLLLFGIRDKCAFTTKEQHGYNSFSVRAYLEEHMDLKCFLDVEDDFWIVR